MDGSTTDIPADVRNALRALGRLFSAHRDICRKCRGGCCRDCGPSHGYLCDAEWRTLKREYSYTPRRGFKTPEGCSLPRHKRSLVCQRYACYELDRSMSIKERQRCNRLAAVVTREESRRYYERVKQENEERERRRRAHGIAAHC
jgi:hypothetical protein